jgi:hypothetical protein
MNHIEDSSSQYMYRALPFPLITSASSPRSQAVMRLSAIEFSRSQRASNDSSSECGSGSELGEGSHKKRADIMRMVDNSLPEVEETPSFASMF